MNGYQDRRGCRDHRSRQGRRGRRGDGLKTGKGETEDSDFPISTGEGVELFNIRTNL
ncbi:unnamed protein product [Ectocarpus sp. 12 AP-2014]